MGIPNGTNEGVGRGASYAKLIRIVVRLLGEKGRGNIDGIVVGDGHSMPHTYFWVVLELPLEGSVVGFAGGNKEEARLGHTLSITDGNVEGICVLGSNVGLGDSIKVGFAKICRELTLTLSFFHGKL